VITSLFSSNALANVAEFVPTGFPFFSHWYDGVVPPFTGVAVKTTFCPEQIVFVLALIVTEGVWLAPTVITMVFEVSFTGAAQVAFDVSTQRMASFGFTLANTNVGLFVPAAMPLRNHWKVGEDPPFSAVAVNVAPCPEQIVVLNVLMLTSGITAGVTVIVTLFEIAVADVIQALLEVSVQFTISPPFRAVVEKVALFVPTGLPFIFH
jgi:hypothetical protein